SVRPTSEAGWIGPESNDGKVTHPVTTAGRHAPPDNRIGAVGQNARRSLSTGGARFRTPVFGLFPGPGRGILLRFGRRLRVPHLRFRQRGNMRFRGFLCATLMM